MQNQHTKCMQRNYIHINATKLTNITKNYTETNACESSLVIIAHVFILKEVQRGHYETNYSHGRQTACTKYESIIMDGFKSCQEKSATDA